MRTPEEVKLDVASTICTPSAPLAGWRWWIPVNAVDALFPTVKAQDRKAYRYTVMRYLVGKDSVKDLTESEADALEAWASGDNAEAEAALILDKCGELHGQQRLF